MSWIKPKPAVPFPLLESFSIAINKRMVRYPHFLPTLRSNNELALVSDYAGDNSGFQVLSYVLLDVSELIAWNEKRIQLRKEFQLGDRRLEFKKLGDELKQKILIPFLRSIDNLSGLLVCVAIAKDVPPFWKIFHREIFVDEKTHKPVCKESTWERLHRITLFGSILVAGMSNPNQSIHWISDNDEIFANQQIASATLKVGCGILDLIYPERNSSFKASVAVKVKAEERGLAEDLVSIADLAAGATVENHATLGIERIPSSSNLFIPNRAHRSSKTQFLSAWLSDQTKPLKKLNVLVRATSDGQLLLTFGHLEMHPEWPPIASSLILPHDRGWINSSRWWGQNG